MNKLNTKSNQNLAKIPANGINIGIGMYMVGTTPMTSIGLGSCVAVILHDTRIPLGAMAHVMLPQCNGNIDRPGKYADTAISLMIEELTLLGCNRRSIIAKIIGGASMFRHFQGKLNIGDRNVEQIRKILDHHRISIESEDVGGNFGRTIHYDPLDSGKVIVKRSDGSCIEL